jgi:hypothetical protein
MTDRRHGSLITHARYTQRMVLGSLGYRLFCAKARIFESCLSGVRVRVVRSPGRESCIRIHIIHITIYNTIHKLYIYIYISPLSSYGVHVWQNRPTSWHSSDLWCFRSICAYYHRGWKSSSGSHRIERVPRAIERRELTMVRTWLAWSAGLTSTRASRVELHRASRFCLNQACHGCSAGSASSFTMMRDAKRDSPKAKLAGSCGIRSVVVCMYKAKQTKDNKT